MQDLSGPTPAKALSFVLSTMLLLTVLYGCATPSGVDPLATGLLPHEEADAPEGVRDGRLRFTDIFCTALREPVDEAASMGCDHWLFTPASVQQDYASDEETQPSLASLSDKIQLLIIPGAFSDCFGPEAIAFAGAAKVLQAEGITVRTAVVGGRSGISHNAAEIADYIQHHYAEPGPPLVLVGYSKGTNDALQFLTQYPDLAARVSALVSVAGAVGGSPVADDLHPIYDLLLSHLPWPQCVVGDGKVVQSLRTEIREQWMQSHKLPDHVRYYSLAAITTSERTARALRPTWKALLKYSPNNDGQVLARHALIPGSTLLGYVHADHWSIAITIERAHRMLAQRPDDTEFPHTALLSAITQQVAEDLEPALQ